jgi:hypothetical protein
VSKERLAELLSELSAELRDTGSIDDETRAMLDRLHGDIDRLTGETHESAVDQAKQLESRFAANHPVAARIAREFADLLAKMGI